MRTIKLNKLALPALSKRIVVALTVVVACLTLFSPREAHSFQLPVGPVSPTSMAECNDLYDRYHSIWEKFTEQAKLMSDKAWELAKSRGSKAAKPYYQKASRLHEEAYKIMRAGSEARRVCNRRVHEYKSQMANEQRENQIQQRAYEQQRSKVIKKHNKQVRDHNNQLKRNMTKNLQDGILKGPKSQANNQVNRGKDYALGKLFPGLYPAYKEGRGYGGKAKNALGRFGVTQNRITLAKALYQAFTGEKTIQQDFGNIAGIVSPLAGEALGRHPISQAVFQMLLPAIIGVQGDAINQFEQQMNMFNENSFESQMSSLASANNQSNPFSSENLDNIFANLRTEDETLERDYDDKIRQEEYAKVQAEEVRRQRIAREQQAAQERRQRLAREQRNRDRLAKERRARERAAARSYEDDWEEEEETSSNNYLLDAFKDVFGNPTGQAILGGAFGNSGNSGSSSGNGSRRLPELDERGYTGGSSPRRSSPSASGGGNSRNCDANGNHYITGTRCGSR